MSMLDDIPKSMEAEGLPFSQLQHDCDACDGDGIVEGLDGLLHDCFSCGGNGVMDD